MSTPAQPLEDLRFIVAARQSRKPRAGEKVEFPIEAQDKRAKEWGIDQGGQYVDTAADFKSGVVAPWDRPHAKEWVRETGAKIHGYDAIVVTKTDRLSRGTDEDFSMIETWASRNQKKLIIVGPDGGVWYPARHDSDFWQWTAAKRQANREWNDIRDRSMSRQLDLQTARKLSGGAIPFGYDVSGTKFDKTLKPNDLGWEWVPPIFQRIRDGKSLAKVAAWLDSENVKPITWLAWSKTDPDERGPEPKWSPKSIAQMIRNRIYIGERRADLIINGQRLRGKGVVRIEVEPLVDASLWLAANKRLDNAPRGGRRGPKNWEPALLTGSLFCQKCGAPMYRLKVRGGYVYYRCHGFLPNPKGCGTLVAESLMDSIVDNEMRDNDDAETYDYVFEPGEETQIQEEIDRIRVKLLDLPTKGLSYEEEDAERAKLRTKREELESQLKNAKPDRWTPKAVLNDDGTPLTEADRWKAADLAGKREILKKYRITFMWDEFEGERYPRYAIVPTWLVPQNEPNGDETNV